MTLPVNDLSPKHEQDEHKLNRHANISLAIGLITFLPSLFYLILAYEAWKSPGSVSDFQGALCIPLFLMGMAPIGAIGVVIGVNALISKVKNKVKDRGMAFTTAGIILNLPGLFNLLYICYGFMSVRAQSQFRQSTM